MVWNKRGRDHRQPLGGRGNAHRRDSWVRSVLAGVAAGSRLLDVGAGERRYRGCCDHLEYVSQDFGEYDGLGDGQGLQSGIWSTSSVDIVSDIGNIPVPDGSFDVVLCTEVLEHVKYPADALREMWRVLRPGGELVLTAPFCSLTHMAPYHYYSGFNRYFFEEVLGDIGFVDIAVESNGDFFDFLAQELYRLPYAASRYAGWKAQWALKILVAPLLLALGHLRSIAKDSDHLVCFGFHVTAIKTSAP